MSQDSLFDASVYIVRAYEALVLAYNAQELEQLETLKAQVLRTYIAVLEMRTPLPMQEEQLEWDGAF